MEYRVRVWSAPHGHVVPLLYVAEAMAKRAASSYGTNTLHGPTLKNLRPERVRLLWDAAMSGQLTVCDSQGRIASATELVETARASAAELAGDASEAPIDAENILPFLFAKRQHLIEWGKASGDVFLFVETPGTVVDSDLRNFTEAGYGEVIEPGYHRSFAGGGESEPWRDDLYGTARCATTPERDEGHEAIPVLAIEPEPPSPESEKWRLFWRAVRFDENRVEAAMSELEHFPPKGISDIAFRDEKIAALQANLAQIACRKDELTLQMGTHERFIAERRFFAAERVESRKPLDKDDALERTREIELANKEIDALIAERTGPLMGLDGAPNGVKPDKTGLLPVEQGLSTKDIAQTFDGVNGWGSKRWRKNLSASKWLHSARISIGGAGGASSVWNPLILAQLMHGKTTGKKAKETLMRTLNSRFTLTPALGPWRDDFNEYFATHCAAD